MTNSKNSWCWKGRVFVTWKKGFDTHGRDIKKARELSIKNQLFVKYPLSSLKKNLTITMWHVLEHVYDLDGIWKKIKSY